MVRTTTMVADEGSRPRGDTQPRGDEPQRPAGAAAAISWLRLAGALLAVAACAVAQWYIRARSNWYTANLVLVAGSVAAALLLGRPAPGLPGEGRGALAPAGRWSWMWGAIAVLGLGAVAFATYRLATRWAADFTVAAPLDIVGWVVCTVGLARWQRRRQAPASRLSLANWEIALLIVIVALGFFLRFYRYTYFPPPYGVAAVEEPQEGQGAYSIAFDGARPWEFVGDRWLPVPFFKLWGVSLTTLRIPFTLISGFTVLALYFLLRQLVSRPAALLCTALFAVCHWHLMYARIAHNIFATTLLVVIVLALCARVHRRGGLAVYPWIGFLCGYTLYTYAGYRGTTLVVSLFLGLSFLAHLLKWRRAEDAEARAAARGVVGAQAAGLSLFALALVLTAVPLASQLRSNPSYYFEAANRSLVDREYYTSDVNALLAQRITRLKETALIFNHSGDGSATFNLPGEPMLDPIAGTLLVLGLAYTVIWGRYRFQGFFAFAFVALLILGTTFVHNLDVRRLQGIIPLLFVLIAFFVDRLWQVVSAKLGRAGHVGITLLAIVVAAVSLRVNYDVYFNRWITNQGVRLAFQNYYTVAIRYIHTLPSNAYVLFVSDALNLFVGNDFAWLRGNRVPGTAVVDLMPVFAGQTGPWTGRDLRVLIQEPYDRSDMARLLRERYPAAQCEPIESIDDPSQLWMTACRVPQGGVMRALGGGVRARYFYGDQPVPYLERIEPAISFAFEPAGCASLPGSEGHACRAEWEGTWTVPQAGTYELAAEVRSGVIQATVDDQPATHPLQLAAGPHVIRVEARLPRADHNSARLRWRNPATQRWELVDFATFDDAANQPP
jgi:hypothetical protein